MSIDKDSKPWKVIVAGSRNLEVTKHQVMCAVCLLPSFDKFEQAINDYHIHLEFVSGACPTGPDQVAIEIAEECEITLKEFPADWTAHGKAAGPIRNRQMAEYASALVLLWNGSSRGSANMLKEAKAAGLEIVQVIL